MCLLCLFIYKYMYVCMYIQLYIYVCKYNMYMHIYIV